MSLGLHLSTTEPSKSGLVSDPFGRADAFPGLPNPSSFPSLVVSDGRNIHPCIYGRLIPVRCSACIHTHVQAPRHVCARLYTHTPTHIIQHVQGADPMIGSGTSLSQRLSIRPRARVRAPGCLMPQFPYFLPNLLLLPVDCFPAGLEAPLILNLLTSVSPAPTTA